MQADFWHRRWQQNEIGFHEADGNHLLKAHIDALTLADGARVFVPLCGKTRDIAWLLSKGYSVVGIELNESAVLQLFGDLNLAAKPSSNLNKDTGLQYFHNTFSNGLTLDIYQGDFFAFHAKVLGDIDAVYDRGALVALPAQMRRQYCAHLLNLTQSAKQLLVCYQYKDGLIQGPPHSVSHEEINSHYRHTMHIQELYTGRVEGGFREKSEVFESVYLLCSHKN
ncbi:thiopurine S-methyltransferase [Glaciecola punicea ACAM 611]|jgi:thiopurine S-methyltransferase|uniref:Thiopurine S-methyltransferase n=1 Tax=Glaciecola punicea ACAM 611 TaxID=1121923 RepID=H5TC70_9ALTE|nr:thiopurine S-methyltransferase [Glaciecola punicea]OFA32046.1 hypothetical protein BAE46_07350 [Glaciecola punicea]GAB55897.1 thiopurine S-methyltransferase [Glaciecola punicea ACAM 611]